MIEKSNHFLTARHAFLLGAFLFGLTTITFGLLLVSFAKDAAIFGSFWESGKAAGLGRNPYLLYPRVWVPDNAAPPIPEVNLNPPSVLPLFQIFALFDPMQGRLVWLGISAGLYALGVWSIYCVGKPNSIQILWLFLCPLAFSNLALGQIYTLLMLLGIASWYCLRENRSILASIFIGVIVAIKPNFAVWGFLAFASRHYREAVVAGIVAFALSALPAILYGPDVFSQWMAAAELDRHNLFPHDVSLHGFFYRLGFPDAAYAPIAALCLSILYWAYRTKPSLYDITPVAIVVGMLCSPIAWIDYIFIIAPFIVDRQWGRPMLAGALLVCLESQWVGFVRSERWMLLLVSIAAIAPAIIMLGVFVRRAGRDARE